MSSPKRPCLLLRSLVLLASVAGCAPPRAVGYQAGYQPGNQPGQYQPGAYPAPGAPPPVSAQPLAIKKSYDGVFLVKPIGGLGLFSDEQITVQKQVAGWARSRGFQVAPVEMIEKRLAHHRRGEKADGSACGRPLPPFQAVPRYAADMGVTGEISGNVYCKDGTCELSISARRGFDYADSKNLGRWEAPYSNTEATTAAFAKALNGLAPPPANRAGGMGGILGDLLSGGVVTARKKEELKFSAWKARAVDTFPKDAFRSALSFPGGAEPLRACVSVADDGAELLVSVDTKGRIERCESRNADDAGARCACAAFTKYAQGAEVIRGARAHVGISFRGPDDVTATNLKVSGYVNTHLMRHPKNKSYFQPKVSHPSIMAWQPPNTAVVTSCFMNRSKPGKVSPFVDVHFDATGAVSRVTFMNDESYGLDKHEVGCVRRAFMMSTAPCPAVPKSVARARLTMRFEKVGAKRPGLGVLGVLGSGKVDIKPKPKSQTKP